MSELVELAIPVSEQMVTVWPINYDGKAIKLNMMRAGQDDVSMTDLCYDAVRNYGLVTSLRAMKQAEFAGADLSGRGPFLIAWSPASHKGRRDALVLVMDLSNVTNFQQAQERIQRWSRDIEQKPDLWNNGWDLEETRIAIRLWADAYGSKILALFGAKE